MFSTGNTFGSTGARMPGKTYRIHVDDTLGDDCPWSRMEFEAGWDRRRLSARGIEIHRSS